MKCETHKYYQKSRIEIELIIKYLFLIDKLTATVMRGASSHNSTTFTTLNPFLYLRYERILLKPHLFKDTTLLKSEPDTQLIRIVHKEVGFRCHTE